MEDSETKQTLAQVYEQLRSIEKRLYDLEAIALAARDTLEASELATTFQKAYREHAARIAPLREETVREITAALRSLRAA